MTYTALLMEEKSHGCFKPQNLSFNPEIFPFSLLLSHGPLAKPKISSVCRRSLKDSLSFHLLQEVEGMDRQLGISDLKAAALGKGSTRKRQDYGKGSSVSDNSSIGLHP